MIFVETSLAWWPKYWIEAPHSLDQNLRKQFPGEFPWELIWSIYDLYMIYIWSIYDLYMISLYIYINKENIYIYIVQICIDLSTYLYICLQRSRHHFLVTAVTKCPNPCHQAFHHQAQIFHGLFDRSPVRPQGRRVVATMSIWECD